MDIVMMILAGLLIFIGLAGCILPALPGPPISYVGLLLLQFQGVADFSWTQLLVWLMLVVFILVLDYFIPILGSKYAGGSQWGSWGCLVGTVIGLFFMPLGIILGPFLGAVIGELLGNKELKFALKSGLGSLAGFILGTFFKLMLCGYFIYQYLYALKAYYAS